MPLLNKDFILYMIDQTGRYDIVIPELPKGFQTLHAIYSRNCLLAMKRMIDTTNELKITGFSKEVRILGITEEKIKPFEKDGRIFLNINTPEDLVNADD